VNQHASRIKAQVRGIYSLLQKQLTISRERFT
jgi:hypothetical protein